MQLPSVSNTAGTVAGMASFLVSAPVVNAVAASSAFAAASAATGGLVPAAALAYAALGIGSMAVNYGVTHWAQVKNLDQKFASWWPMISVAMSLRTENTFPTDKNGQTSSAPVSEGTPNENINRAGL